MSGSCAGRGARPEGCAVAESSPAGESRPAPSVRTQLRTNFVALLSLVVALGSLSYTAWRTEHSESNRTMRQADFQLLVALGQMQELVYRAHYDRDPEHGNPRSGWVYVQTISDYSAAMPAPIPMRANELLVAWRNHWEGLAINDADADAITDALDACRAAVVANIQALR